jgi:hypothetical protein
VIGDVELHVDVDDGVVQVVDSAAAASFEVFRTGAMLAMRHVPCGSRIPLGREPVVTVRALAWLAAQHKAGCEAVS